MIADYSQYRLSRKEKLTFGLGLLIFLFLCSHLFYQNMVLALSFPLLYFKGERWFSLYLSEKRKNRLLAEFRDFLFSLSTSFSTGRHMTEGLKEAESYLLEIHGEQSILTEEIRHMLKAIDETGKHDLDVFQGFAMRAGLEDIFTFVDVFRACRETGGDMVSAVNKAAALLSEKINMESEIRTMVSQKKFEGRIIAAMPFLMIFFLQWMSPEYLEVMYTTASGRLLMTAALGLTILTYLWIERMTNVEV